MQVELQNAMVAVTVLKMIKENSLLHSNNAYPLAASSCKLLMHRINGCIKNTIKINNLLVISKYVQQYSFIKLANPFVSFINVNRIQVFQILQTFTYCIQ